MVGYVCFSEHVCIREPKTSNHLRRLSKKPSATVAGVHWRDVSRAGNCVHPVRDSGVPPVSSNSGDRYRQIPAGSDLIRRDDFFRVGELLEVKEAAIVRRASAYKSRSDSELVAMCLQGDALAWETLIRRYRRLMFSVPVKFGFSPADAADVFQNACLDFLEHLPDLKDDRKVGGWLLSATTNRCLDLTALRQKESGTEIEVEEPLDPLGSVEDIKLQAERHQSLRDAVEALPKPCKSLITMLYLDPTGPSYEDIASDLGIPIGSIGPNKARCLDRLRKMIRTRRMEL